jgi:NAD(P)-dependent dehydrogenase (short-subunit alcohol dehydrogenase family)
MTTQDLRGKVAVITGAGSGLGLELARSAAASGMKLALADVQADALAAAQAEFEAQGIETVSRIVDVADGAKVSAFADEVHATFGTAHLLFNNAGVGTAGLIWENSERDWSWTLGVNLWGVIHGIRAFVPRMIAAANNDAGFHAHVVNTASMAGLVNPPMSGVYNVSKHAVVALTETLYHDLALVTQQVNCSVLCPFYVPTGIHQSARNRPEALVNEDTQTASQRVAQAMVEKAVTHGRVTAAQVAQLTFAAIAENRFYIVSHPQALESVRIRGDDIVGLRNPTDPLAQRPAVREAMIAALKS